MELKKNQYLESIMKKSGWDKDRAEAAVSEAKERLGISASMYDRLDLWNVDEKLHEKVYLEYREKREKRRKQKEDAILSIMEKTGWSHDEAEKIMTQARERIGIRYSEYAKHDFHLIPEEQQKDKYEEILAQKEKRRIRKEKEEKRIQSIMEKTGWDREKAISEFKDAKERTGITYKDYDELNFHEIDADKQKESYAVILEERARKKKIREKKEAQIAQVMEKTGWDREKARSEINSTRKKFDISIREYVDFGFCLLDEEEQKERYERVLARREKVRASREYYISKVMEKTGWEYDQAVEIIDEARRRTGCKYKEYYWFRFDEMTNEQQEAVYTIAMSSQMSERYNVDPEFRGIVNNKVLCDEYFDEFMGRAWSSNQDVSLERFKETFRDCTRIIYKPSNGIGGQGIEAFDVSADNMEEIYEHLISLPEGVVEEYVVQHEDMARLCPTSVNTLRVVTIVSKEKPVLPDGRYEDIAYISIRIGGGKAIVDNFHEGGMVAAIDLETGIIDTDAVDMAGNVYETHPVTGVRFKGYQIPCFEQVKEAVLAACRKEKTAGNIGWDMAISENGPVIIEVNVGPGPELLSAPYAIEKKGKKYIFEKYI